MGKHKKKKSSEKRELKKIAKKLKKHRKRKEKQVNSSLVEENKKSKKHENVISNDIPIELMERSKKMAPMTKEEWEKKQSIIRKVLDEESGRYRLIKGDGEVLEEIVTREQHKQINQQATKADGDFFKLHTIGNRNI